MDIQTKLALKYCGIFLLFLLTFVIGWSAGYSDEEHILQRFLDSSEGRVCVVKQVGLDIIKRCYRLEEVR